MLKIKDYVDLKELEKFGFINKCGMIWKPKRGEWSVMEIEVLEDRSLKIAGCPDLFHTVEDTLYDLINADFVEKVKE